jgi:DNA invertase Pin-like site-specific DNA recombinase
MPVALADVSQYETVVRKERQLAGIVMAKAEGQKWGGRHAVGHQQGRQTQGNPEQGDARGANDDLADEDGQEEGGGDCQGTEPVEANSVRGTTAA